MTANYTVDGIEYNWQTGRPVISVTKFMNKEGEIDSLVINPQDDTVTIENSEGTVLANYVDGKFAPTDDGIGSVISNEVIYTQNFGHAFGLLDDIDQEKLSIYASQKDIDGETISDLNPSTIVDGAYDFSLYGEGMSNIDPAEGNAVINGVPINPDFGKPGWIDPPQSTKRPWKLQDVNLLKTASYPSDPEGFFIGRYPINQKDTNNFDYLKITCYDYEPGLFQPDDASSLLKIKDIDKRVKNRRGVVSLPIQPGISESNSVGWGNAELNPIQLVGANIAGSAMDFLSGGGTSSITRSVTQIKETAKEALGDNWEAIIKSYFAGQAVGADLIGRATGQTINKNVEVLFNGPNLRTS